MFCTLKGTSSALLIAVGVANAAPPRVTGLKLLAKTSIRPAKLLAAYNWLPAVLMASPVYIAAGVVAVIVEVKPPAQPEMVPFRLAKMKRADVLATPGVNWNAAVFAFETIPVGPCGPVAVVGMPTKPFAFTAVTLLTFVAPVTA